MGNTLEETEPTNSTEGTTITKYIHENCSEPTKLWIPNKSLDAMMNNAVNIMGDDLSLEQMPTAVNTPTIVKRARGIAN